MSTQIDLTEVITCKLLEACASDIDVVNAARISYGGASTQLNERDEGLIRYLVRERHGSPFEHGYFRFLVEVPVFVVREHHRHRAGHSYNEVSGRYTELEPRFYLPSRARVQEGRPGHYVYVERSEDHDLSRYMRERAASAYIQSWAAYEDLLAQGVAKEQARMVLPLGIYTKMIWSCNPRALMHFLSLRTAPNAQAEIQREAGQAEIALQAAMPVTYDAWVQNGRVAP